MWTCGWCVSAEPVLSETRPRRDARSTPVMAIRAPRWRGEGTVAPVGPRKPPNTAMVVRVSAEVRNNSLWTSRLFQ